MIERAASSDPYVREILARHPRVAEVLEGNHAGVDFQIGGWRRSVVVGDAGVEIGGLMELMDNNPVVCADVVAVPPPASTLALIALGPLAWAGLLTERPVVVGVSPAPEDIHPWMATAGWASGVTTEVYPGEENKVVSVAGIGVIATPENWDDIDELYDERFARSFYVRRVEDWRPDIALGQPYAAYHIQCTDGDGQSLVRVSVAADLHGKCGAAQVVHAMNVMAGFEESQGIL
ncbi:MAG TPA: hypothetical protein VK934_06990 [Fimbriimonas sp.]|nr:hypothetical protein [Fimbriimonas sp.]